MYLEKKNDKILNLEDSRPCSSLCFCSWSCEHLDTFFNKKYNQETSQNHYLFELTGSNSLFIFSLALWDINLQNISQQTKVITFIEKANSAKPCGTVLYLSPCRCRLWVELEGLEVNLTLSSLVKGRWVSSTLKLPRRSPHPRPVACPTLSGLKH